MKTASGWRILYFNGNDIPIFSTIVVHRTATTLYCVFVSYKNIALANLTSGAQMRGGVGGCHTPQ